MNFIPHYEGPYTQCHLVGCNQIGLCMNWCWSVQLTDGWADGNWGMFDLQIKRDCTVCVVITSPRVRTAFACLSCGPRHRSSSSFAKAITRTTLHCFLSPTNLVLRCGQVVCGAIVEHLSTISQHMLGLLNLLSISHSPDIQDIFHCQWYICSSRVIRPCQKP